MLSYLSFTVCQFVNHLLYLSIDLYIYIVYIINSHTYCYLLYYYISLLKSIVAKWYDDMVTRDDAISNSLLTTLYRYLCGYGDSLLQDTALHRVVYNLMTKLFKRLIF